MDMISFDDTGGKGNGLLRRSVWNKRIENKRLESKEAKIGDHGRRTLKWQLWRWFGTSTAITT